MGERLYEDLASWWALLSPPEESVEESDQILRWLGPVGSVLELGSGCGRLAQCIPPEVEVVLVDRAPAMVKVSCELNPSREHICADMITLELGRTFDAVVLHDAVMYLTTADQLLATFHTAAKHLRPGGRFVVLPDFVGEDFEEHLISGTRADEHRAMSMTEWHWDPDPNDGTVQVDFMFLLKEDGVMSAVHDVHTMGLHSRDRFWRCLRSAGFRPLEVPLDDLRPEGEVFLVERV